MPRPRSQCLGAFAQRPVARPLSHQPIVDRERLHVVPLVEAQLGHGLGRERTRNEPYEWRLALG